MPVHGQMQLKKNVKKWFDNLEKKTDKVLLTIAMTGAGYAKLETPVDTAALINSQYYRVFESSAVVGYMSGFSDTGFNYALHLHDSVDENGVPFIWHPVKKKDAKDHFLSDAFESPGYLSDYRKILVNGYKL